MKNLLNSFRNAILFLAFLSAGNLTAQNPENSKKKDVYVDDNGIMRWGHNDDELMGFGVNYSAPFAHGFRSAQKLGVELKEAIEKDVYHFSRLGFDLYRIHVWDTEISDTEGNLLENEHLELFDYLLKQLKDRGINFVITPIAYWGNGWPEPDEETPGFSHKYGKAGSLTHPEAIKAQENYLTQFLEHVNPHTGVAYKDEPNLIAFEISNEPHHKGEPEAVKEFIQRMVTSMRSTGTKKPILYNVSHSIQLADTYFDAGIDGGTFQWYPTGLGFQKELEGNLLPNVDDYYIPFDEVIEANNAAKLVYEFDAADMMKTYMYPAMARSFREAGIQIGTHFAYDPTFVGHLNTEYNTHYMNLVYTPRKALALLISGEVFHEIPMNSDFGVYPQNKEFGDFIVNYEDDLAEYNSGEKFYYTNTTTTKPKSIEDLQQIAGFGDSEVVKYEGRGAYFLDKLKDGVWRLEIMPDAFLVKNPFGSNSLDRTVAVINWEEWEMSLRLPEIGEYFSLEALNEGNNYTPEVSGHAFKIEPGTYLIKAEGISSEVEGNETWDYNRLNEFAGIGATVEQTYVLHEPVQEIIENSNLKISAEIVSDENIEIAEAWLQNGNEYETLQLTREKAYCYSAEIPEKMLEKGFLEYRIIVTTKEGNITFPGAVEGSPADWDFYADEQFKTRIISEDKPLYIFNAIEDYDYVVRKWLPTLNLIPLETPGQAEFQVNVEELFEKDEENPKADTIYDYSFRYVFKEDIEGRKEELKNKQKLVIKGRSLNEKPLKLQVALLMKNGAAFGKIIELDPETGDYEIDLAQLEPVKTVTLPRPYPSFLSYYFEHSYDGEFHIEEAESLQFSIGPGLDEEELEQEHGVGLINVRLE